MTGWRCAASSVARGEPLLGTASTLKAFLLVEQPGPWGTDALLDSRLPSDVAGELHRRCRSSGVRPLLIRRHGRRPAADRTTVFAAYSEPGAAWVESSSVSSAEDLLAIDLPALGGGRSPRLTPHTGPLFLVCTHGRHDVCCAERGRPLAAALGSAHPGSTWEVSHIGGDRFAGNVLVLPQGLYYGRLGIADALMMAAKHLGGDLDLEHLRGRSGYSFAVQAAEIYLRRHLAEASDGALALLSTSRDRDQTTAVFAHGPARWRVRVLTTRATAEQLTCRSTRTDRAPGFRLTGLSRLPAGLPPVGHTV